MKKSLIIAFLSVFVFASGMAQGIKFDDSNWTTIVAKAKKENKLIFMDAYTSWCGPCKMLQAKVFPDNNLGNFFNSNFVNFKVDMEKGEGPFLAGKYPVRGYPTLFFINPHTGQIVNSVLGYRDVNQLLSIGKNIFEKKVI